MSILDVHQHFSLWSSMDDMDNRKRHTAEEKLLTLLSSCGSHAHAWINDLNSEGLTLLMLSARSGFEVATERLLQLGASINLLSPDDKTALFFAAEAGQTQCALRLAEVGAMLHCHSARLLPHKHSFLSHALVEHNRWETLDALLPFGLDVNELNFYRQTPLQSFCRPYPCDEVGLIDKLLARGADAHHADFRGQQVLHTACIGNSPQCLERLLQAGVFIDALDHQDFTPLMHAAEQGHIGICQRLIDHQARINTYSFEGQTAVDLARESGHFELASFLESHLLDAQTKDLPPLQHSSHARSRL